MSADKALSVAVLVSGTGTLLRAIMDYQDAHPCSYRVDLVVADQVCPAIERAKNAGIPTAIVEMEKDRDAWNAHLAETVSSCSPDLVVSAGFMRILGRPFLDVYEGKTINTHPSLLPAFPGAHAVRDALAYGVKVTGCTVHFVDDGMDTGRIIAQRPVLVQPGDTESSLHERIKQEERRQVTELLATASIHEGKVTFE
ncbi:phosphoribosylglycinamide formyltransferase [Corynebacterium pseudogenitalium]|uniref:phosphoribosylglycinamide formyltransferase n=1 Tax=Corynebacterium pseudogenitalium TaxID=38303 RepID=UPI00210A17E1